MSKDYYFDESVDQAIVEYNNTDSQIEKNRIYREKIQEPFRKLAEHKANTKFDYYATTKEDFINKIVAHLVEKIDKYDPDEGKAFSYFNFIAYTKGMSINEKNYKKMKRHTSIEDEDNDFTFPQPPENELEDEMNEFVERFIEYWEEKMVDVFDKPRDQRIADAIIDIFKNRDCINVFKKRILYTMIRDHSGVEKPQYITRVVREFKEHYYKAIKQFRENGEIMPRGKDKHKFF